MYRRYRPVRGRRRVYKILNMNTKTLIVIYEMQQVGDVVALAAQTPDSIVVSLNYWVERELHKHGVVARPLTDYYPAGTDFRALLTLTQDLSRQWYQLPSMSFFSYSDLKFGEMFEGVLCDYLQQARYYLFVFERILESHPDAQRLIVPQSKRFVSATAGPFAAYEVGLVAKVAAYAAKAASISYETRGTLHVATAVLFPPQPLVRRVMLRTYNAMMKLCTPKRSLRIFVSDHWKNISSVMAHLTDAQLTVMDRKELRTIPWRELWKYRVRFVHPLDVLTPQMLVVARAERAKLKEQWRLARGEVEKLPGFQHAGTSWWPLVEDGFDNLVAVYSERIVADVEALRFILQKERTNRVLLRASISGQHHFFILGNVPPTLGTPSMEIQHGIGVGEVDPNGVFSRLQVEYLLAYGTLMQQAFVRNHGYEASRIVPVGSPRFDRYFTEHEALTPESRDAQVRTLGLDPKRPVVFVVMPEEVVQLTPYCFSSYEFRDFLIALREVKQRLPEIQFILKFRYITPSYRECAEEVLPHDAALVDARDPYTLALLSDVVYSGNSTLVIETLIAKKPVVLFPLKSGDVYFKAAYQDAVIPVDTLDEVVAATKKLIETPEYAAAVVEKGTSFLHKNFAFDAHSADRVATFIRSLSLP